MFTMKDIAKEAGLSQPTVSLVLNGHYSICAETRKRVLETAERLGYRRNEIARAIKTGKTNVIGLSAVCKAVIRWILSPGLLKPVQPVVIL